MKNIILLCLIVIVCGAPQNDDIYTLINSVFNITNVTENVNIANVMGKDSVDPVVSQIDDKSCILDDDTLGECVLYYLCGKNRTIILNGAGVLDLRVDIEKPCPDYMDVCCSIGQITKKPIRAEPSPDRNVGGCGIRNPDGVGFKIIGNTDEAKFGEFPWMAAILSENDMPSNIKLHTFICGGSLIHPKVVMTAAHCVASYVDSSIKLKIRAGEWDTQTKDEIYPSQDKYVAKIILHPEYFADAVYNDMALMILESPVEDDLNIGYVCLPPAGLDPPNLRCFASGWGKDVFGKAGNYQVILKKLELPIVEHGQCQKELRKTRLGQRFELHDSFVCAGGEPGKDTCKGDGGSPLMCPMIGKPNRFMQSGIVSWGIGCGDEGTPGVYVHVGALREWIDKQMIANNIDMTPYAP